MTGGAIARICVERHGRRMGGIRCRGPQGDRPARDTSIGGKSRRAVVSAGKTERARAVLRQEGPPPLQPPPVGGQRPDETWRVPWPYEIREPARIPAGLG